MRSPYQARAGASLALVAAAFVLVSAACSINTIGGREKCWPEGESRASSLWHGTLRIDAAGGRLETPEGDVIPLLPGALATRIGSDGLGELVRRSDVVARAGDDVTIFGGAGADGALVVCAVEAVH